MQIVELNSLSSKLRDLEKRFEQLVSSRRSEDDTQRQMMELQRQVELLELQRQVELVGLQRQVELIQQREMKLTRAFRAAQRQQSLETSRIQRLTLRNRDVRTADDAEYKGEHFTVFTCILRLVSSPASVW